MIKSIYPQLNDRDWLYQRYVTERKTAGEIAAEVGCNKHAVYRALRKHGIERIRGRRPAAAELEDRVALAARADYQTVTDIARDLNTTPGAVSHYLKKYGLSTGTRSEAIKAGLRKKFPDGRSGENAGNWKGGRHTTSAGYVTVHSPDHPRATSRDWVFEHILVAEEKLGRLLEPGEVVHHINRIRHDNRPENLRVLQAGQHIADHFADGRDADSLRAETEVLRAENFRLRGLLLDNGLDPDGTP
jgi:hypothetical protein